jgi:hypothetical protein
MAETKKYIVVSGPINHDHELYQDGDEIDLGEKAAKRLLLERKILAVQAPPGKNDGGKDGGQDAGGISGDKAAGLKEGKEDNPKDKTKGQTKGGKK